MSDVTDNAYVLHSRPYTDSRIIIEFFTEQHGRIAGLFRLPSKKRHFKPQPFTCYTIHWRWGSELKTILVLDAIAAAIPLIGKASYCGLYLNELILRLLRKEDAYPVTFDAYTAALTCLSRAAELDVPLRQFELTLLVELGYGIDFSYDSMGAAIIGGRAHAYSFSPGEGFVRIAFSGEHLATRNVYDGAVLNQIAEQNFESSEVKQAAKQICRICLAPLLGNKPLKSRELFQ